MFALNCRRAIVLRAIVVSSFCRRAIVGALLSCAHMTGYPPDRIEANGCNISEANYSLCSAFVHQLQRSKCRAKAVIRQ